VLIDTGRLKSQSFTDSSSVSVTRSTAICSFCAARVLGGLAQCSRGLFRCHFYEFVPIAAKTKEVCCGAPVTTYRCVATQSKEEAKSIIIVIGTALRFVGSRSIPCR
jgi:hypothetical protein